jgi:flagellum-specific peptidoglycan hydrolase FlgJ
VTASQRTTNLHRIAKAAVHIERTRNIPAELTTGQCILESGWLGKAIGQNAFGIKAVRGQLYRRVVTTERLTPKQLEAERAKGYRIVSYNNPVAILEQDFADYLTLEECFEAYADLLTKGRYFKDRFARYLEHRDLERLLSDMSGKDGQPPYFTGAGYVDLWRAIVNQVNVKAAIAEARSAT